MYLSQMTALEAAVTDLSIDALGAEEATRRQQQQRQLEDGVIVDDDDDEGDLAGIGGGVSAACRLRRGLRKLGRLRQPQNVLEFLAAARGRGETMSLRVFK